MKLKQWVKEQATAETFFGAFIYVPWGAGFVYFALYNIPFLYRYSGITGGIFLIVLGLRKMTVNRVKQALKLEKLIKERKNVADI